MITIPQAEILALLKDFKCLRYTHVKTIMAAKHGSSDEQFSKMVRQLSFLGKLRSESEFIMLPGRKMDERVIKAFDVVMELSDGCLGFLSLGTSPFTLLFTVQKSNAPPSNKVFGVVNVERYSENIINAQLNAGDRDMTVIFILQDKEQSICLLRNAITISPCRMKAASTNF